MLKRLRGLVLRGLETSASSNRNQNQLKLFFPGSKFYLLTKMRLFFFLKSELNSKLFFYFHGTLSVYAQFCKFNKSERPGAGHV